MNNAEVLMAESQTQRDQKILEALVMDSDLERLEALSAQFNIFEAIGVDRQELRHSNFLSFLLDPHQNHGMGDILIKRLLQRALSSAQDISLPVTPIDLDVWDLTEMEVRREWEN